MRKAILKEHFLEWLENETREEDKKETSSKSGELLLGVIAKASKEYDNNVYISKEVVDTAFNGEDSFLESLIGACYIMLLEHGEYGVKASRVINSYTISPEGHTRIELNPVIFRL